MKAVSWEISQHFLKMAESNSAFVKIFRAAEFFQSIGMFNKMISSPVFTVAVYKIWFTGSGMYEVQCLSLRITTLFQNLFF